MNARPPGKRYRQLDPDRIVQTVKELTARIKERFPTSGLAQVADDLAAVSGDAVRTARRVNKPDVLVRVVSYLLTATLIGLIALALIFLRVESIESISISDFFQGIESMVNDIIFAALAIWFAFSLERRRKRHFVLGMISQLRSLAHVIDMHQLTKDPNVTIAQEQFGASVDNFTLNHTDLTRYLDFCSEMLSLLSKLGALQVQSFEDPVSLDAMTDFENLTNGLSRKIWQKIMIIDRLK